ncbi:MAG: class I SAM-dependent methyltransferase [Thermodesulfobacteriota bacterium]
MEKHVCPPWVGYLLVSPLRRWLQNPYKILAPYLRKGQTVLDIGAGMGFYAIPAAELVGSTGLVIAVDIQEEMMKGLEKRARKAGVFDRIELRLSSPKALGVSQEVDVCLAFNVVHEVPDPRALLSEIRSILRKKGLLLFSEPRFHVSEAEFDKNLDLACDIGFSVQEKSTLAGRSAVLVN